ncbi:MAG: FAD:protein FMN transferase [Bacilli bacterium]|nr:FAD:protein FMN transferase [Bacilli bacterium]
MKLKKTLIILLPLILSSCGNEEVKYYQGFDYGIFHSFVSWTYGAKGEDFSNEITSYLERLDDLSDPYYPMAGEANLFSLNESSDWVAVDPVLYDLLKTATDLKEKTEGYFDPYIGKLTKLWKNTLFGEEEDIFPTQEEIDEAATKVPELLEEANSFSLSFDEENKKVKRNGTAHIDLGGLVKGYAVEQIEKIMSAHGSTIYNINGGQSSVGLGNTKSGKPFTVSVMYSKVEGENTFKFKEKDTSGSGVYEQQYRLNGKIYNHIVNPKTGMPLSDYSMAFLVGDDSSVIDAFATACMLAGPDKANEWSKKYDFYYSLYKDKDGYTDFVSESSELTAMRANG